MSSWTFASQLLKLKIKYYKFIWQFFHQYPSIITSPGVFRIWQLTSHLIANSSWNIPFTLGIYLVYLSFSFFLGSKTVAIIQQLDLSKKRFNFLWLLLYWLRKLVKIVMLYCILLTSLLWSQSFKEEVRHREGLF